MRSSPLRFSFLHCLLLLIELRAFLFLLELLLLFLFVARLDCVDLGLTLDCVLAPLELVDVALVVLVEEADVDRVVLLVGAGIMEHFVLVLHQALRCHILRLSIMKELLQESLVVA